MFSISQKINKKRSQILTTKINQQYEKYKTVYQELLSDCEHNKKSHEEKMTIILNDALPDGEPHIKHTYSTTLSGHVYECYINNAKFKGLHNDILFGIQMTIDQYISQLRHLDSQYTKAVQTIDLYYKKRPTQWWYGYNSQLKNIESKIHWRL
jgi:hypothetical protein